MSKFKVGDRVGVGIDECGEFSKKIVYQGEYTDEPVIGTVQEVLARGKVKVLFDEENYNEVQGTYNQKTGVLQNKKVVPVELDSKMLLSEADAKAKFSELEKEYDAVADQVRAKLKEAGKLVLEAHKLAKKAGAESLADMYDATDPLESAMDKAGWRTSSWSC